MTVQYEICKDCPYYFGEINWCMYGEEDVPDNMEKKCEVIMKNNEIYNIVKINNLALSAITPKILDALLELDEKCELDVESMTLNIRIKCEEVILLTKHIDDCYDNREYISMKIVFNDKTEIVLERDMYKSIEII